MIPNSKLITISSNVLPKHLSWNSTWTDVQSMSSVLQEWNDNEKKKETTKELHKWKKLSNYRLLYSAGSNFKDSEVDIPKSMLIKGICTSNFFQGFLSRSKCFYSEFRDNKHIIFFEFTFLLIKWKCTWKVTDLITGSLKEKFSYPFLRTLTAGDCMKECNKTPLYSIKFSSLYTDTFSSQKKRNLHRLRVLLTLSTKSNYAWIHLNITATYICLTWFSFSWHWFTL